MASSVIGALRVNLGLDSAQFEKGARKANDSLKTMRTQFLAVAGVAAAMGTAIATAALKGGQEIDKAAKSARRIGASVTGYRALEMAADDAGVSLSSLANDVQTMNRELARAEIGEGNAGDALERLGLAAADFAGLDADERVALLSDRVRDLGLTSGETTLLLRDLGIRNREMALLVMGGGEALRNARRDVEDFGLAISDVDAARIEAANDEIAGLADITTRVADQLALRFVPALGDMAKAITDSLREGGLLRTVIDGLIDNMGRFATIVGVAVSALGVRYVAAVVAAAGITGTLTAALVALRAALVRTGIGIVVVAAGELVYWLGQVVSAAGTVGEALGRLFDVGKAVFLGVGNTAWGLTEIMAGVASAITGSFVRAFAAIAQSWDALVNGMAAAWNGLAGTAFGETLGLGSLGRSDISGTLGGLADGLFDNAVSSIKSGGDRIRAAGQGVTDAIKESLTVASDQVTGLDAATDAAGRLADALGQLGDGEGGKGGRAGKKAAKGLSEAEKAARDLEKQSQQTADKFGDMVAGIVTGAGSIGDVFKQLGQQLLSSGISGIASSLFKGSGLSEIFAGFFDNGGNIPRGQFGIVGELGPEIVSGPANVTSRVDTARMMQGGGGGVIEVVARVENGSIVQDVRRISGEVAVQVTKAGIEQFTRTGLPQAVDRINKDPRRRG